MFPIFYPIRNLDIVEIYIIYLNINCLLINNVKEFHSKIYT